MCAALLSALMFVTVGFVSAGKADDSMPSQPSKVEMHEKMAQAHQDCLKAGKTEKECHQEMMANCKEAHGGMDCPMMGNMAKMHGKGKMKGMKENKPSSSDEQKEHEAHHKKQ